MKVTSTFNTMSDPSYSKQTIGNLTLLELEKLIKDIAQKTVHQEITAIEQSNLPLLTSTFNTWSDEQTDEEIIADIYESRNSHL